MQAEDVLTGHQAEGAIHLLTAWHSECSFILVMSISLPTVKHRHSDGATVKQLLKPKIYQFDLLLFVHFFWFCFFQANLSH